MSAPHVGQPTRPCSIAQPALALSVRLSSRFAEQVLCTQALFDAQLSSIKGLQAAWHGDCDKRPHTLATRYAALASSLLLLNANYQVRLTHLQGG